MGLGSGEESLGSGSHVDETVMTFLSVSFYGNGLYAGDVAWRLAWRLRGSGLDRHGHQGCLGWSF